MATTTAFTIDLNGVIIHGNISPCSWMYPTYGFQFSLSLKEKAHNVQCVFVHEKALKWEDVEFPMNKVTELAAAWLKANGVKPLQDALDSWIKAEAEFAKGREAFAAKEVRRIARLNAKRKSEGYTHRVFAWVHPERGDDYQVEAFVKGAPTPAQIAGLLKKSVVKDDFKVTAL